MQKITMAEDELLKAIQFRSRTGATALYDMYADSLFGIINRIVKNKEMAEDVLQESFIRIWDSFDQYDASKGRFFTWISAVARNKAKDALRSRQHSEHAHTAPLEDNAEKIDRDNQINFNTDIVGIKLWTASLKKTQRDILDLIYFKGYTHAEVASNLNIPLGTVKGRCRKGLSILRNIYSEFNEPELILKCG